MNDGPKTTKAMAAMAHSLAEVLNARPCDRAHPGVLGGPGEACCLAKERERPWKGRKRPTGEQDPKRMCDSCAAQWHATMAGVILDGLVRGGA